MSCITRQRVGKYIYLYESTSYRDENGMPRNKKIPIGKIDPITKQPVYKQEYLDRMSASGTHVEIPLVSDAVSNVHKADDVEKIVMETLDSVKDYGCYYLLMSIAEKMGLIQCLSATIPDHWQKIFTLACYLVSSDKPVMYCEEWVSSTQTLPVGSMSSQRISELLASFQSSHRNSFYKLWGRHIAEKEYIALDITSISSYSKQIQDCEWGYNRDHENIPQINLCMLLGEQSRLPIYQSIYSGSLKDVSTLRSTLNEMLALIPEKEIQLVMDKGFFSTKNINAMLDSYENCRFLISVPFTHGFAKKQVESERKDIDNIANTILTNDDPIRGIHKVRVWGKEGHKLNTHILFDPAKALKSKNELYGYVTELMRLAIQDKENKDYIAEFNKYLIIRNSEKNSLGYTVNIKEDVISQKLQTSGWLVLISNNLSDTQEAHDIYRAKDIVEKGFDRLKNCLGLNRLRVHGDERMQNKIFVGFIALILMSYIHKVMNDSKLYKMMTMDEMLLTLSKLRTATVNGKKFIRPLTKMHKYIFDIFELKEPVG